jgi:DNA polymerase
MLVSTPKISLEDLGKLGRAAICAGPGNRLAWLDYTGIESCVLADIAEEPYKLGLWHEYKRTRDPNVEPYLIFGRLFKLPEEIARKGGKGVDLGAGYGGVLAVRNFIPAELGLTDDQIKAFVYKWRDLQPEIPRFWKGVERAAVEAIRRAGTTRYGRLTFRFERHHHDVPFLFVDLPSNRSISYPHVTLIRGDRGFDVMSFMDNALCKWVEYQRHGRRGTWGGTLTENIVQGLARDVLAGAMLRLKAAGYRIASHVHDEIIVELPEDQTDFTELQRLAEESPAWTATLPLMSKVHTGLRWADADVPVVHMLGTLDVPPRPKLKSAKGVSTAPAGPVEATPFNIAMLNDMASWAIVRETARHD